VQMKFSECNQGIEFEALESPNGIHLEVENSECGESVESAVVNFVDVKRVEEERRETPTTEEGVREEGRQTISVQTELRELNRNGGGNRRSAPQPAVYHVRRPRKVPETRAVGRANEAAVTEVKVAARASGRTRRLVFAHKLLVLQLDEGLVRGQSARQFPSVCNVREVPGRVFVFIRFYLSHFLEPLHFAVTFEGISTEKNLCGFSSCFLFLFCSCFACFGGSFDPISRVCCWRGRVG
jgi:hypothetical protein